jgi:hypothetical protein
MELNGWTSVQMLRRYGGSARGARARRSYDRIMAAAPLPEPAGAVAPASRKTKYPPLGTGAAAFAIVSSGTPNELICAAVCADHEPETPSHVC